MDNYIGTIVDRLKKMGIDSKTIIFYTSDNGPEAGQDQFFNGSGGLRGHKRDLYEGGIRVPMIVCWPGHISAGKISDHIAGFQDFLPTACDLGGIETPHNIDGISFLPELLGSSQEKHDYMYWEFHEGEHSQAIRKGPWKGVRLNVFNDPDNTIQLFNLDNDPGESKDVASLNPDIVNEISDIIKEAHTPDSNWPLYKSEVKK